MQVDRDFDVLIVGGGIAGLYLLYRLRGIGLSALAFEAGPNVGGTWYWNRYPGARCDVDSVDYQFSFSDELQRGWTWKERYAEQPEILSYLQYVADTLDLKQDIQFETRVDMTSNKFNLLSFNYMHLNEILRMLL